MKSASELLKIFKTCITINYRHVENYADYAYIREGDKLTIYFQQTKGNHDWLRNFQFPAKAYKNSDTTLYFHSGFLSVWKSLKPYISELITDKSIKEIIVAGYSHGAALATICFEYVWYNRPDIRDNITGYGFGAPRVLSSIGLTEEIINRFNNFYIIRNHNDIVTHVPPKLFTYRHVNHIIEIGKNQKYNCFDSHRDYAYIQALNEEITKE